MSGQMREAFPKTLRPEDGRNSVRERKQREPGLEELEKKNTTKAEGPGGQAAPLLCGPGGLG